MADDNRIVITGKLSGLQPFRYTPAGEAVAEFTLAFQQKTLGQVSVGYVDVLLLGEAAEREKDKLRIGRKLCVEGILWSRSFRDRKGARVRDVKVLAKALSA